MNGATMAFRLATVVLIAAVLLLGWIARGAVVIERPPDAEPYAAPEAGAAGVAAPVSAVEPLLEAARRDPFDPERRAAARRFAFADGPATLEPAVTSRPRLVGTALLPGGRGFALCAAGREPARIVHPGEDVNGWVLERVRAGEADFRTPAGDIVTLTVLEPVS